MENILRQIKNIASILFGLILLSSCVSINFTPYRSSEIFQGKGGSIRVVDGVEFWENGEPNEKYKIIGIIDYKANDAPMQNAGKDGKIARKCKEYGGDGVVLLASDREFKGTYYIPFGDGRSATFYKKVLKFQVIKYLK